MQLDDIIIEENFFDKKLISKLWEDCKKLDHLGEDFIDKWGIWKGQKVARQNFFRKFDNTTENDQYKDCPQSLQQVIGKIIKFFNQNIIIREISYTQLFLPWDIHCDLTKEDIEGNDAYKSTNIAQYKPFYNVLIPLHDVDSKTIMFNETSTEYNDFHLYKKNNPQSQNPVSEDIWNENLDMCWDEDRLWLSIKKILPNQNAGQFIAFRRHFFHSSDNFHKRKVPCKHFVQLLLDTKK